MLAPQAQRRGRKIQFQLREPRQIVDCTFAWVYKVRDLMNDKMKSVHAQRLVFYCAALPSEEVEPQLLSYAEHLELT